MKFFISKRRITILTICTLLIVLLLLRLNTHKIISKFELSPFITLNALYVDDTPAEPLAYKCCTQMNNSARTNVFFLKTHKTGSNTVQSVIMRFALINSLDILKVAYNRAYNLPFSDSSIIPDFRTTNGKYHVMSSHMRYDSKLKTYQYPDTPMVTILRNPVTLFQSSYAFFRMDRMTGMSFQEFLNAPTKPERIQEYNIWKPYIGYNQLSVDLGFDLQQIGNSTAIDEFIAKIDREFDFIMITEHMEESMVLLANLMGWPLEQVAFITINARLPSSDSYSLTLRDEITILELNQVDALLYEHFLEKFQRCVRQYGRNKLDDKVQQLKTINKIFYDRCVGEEVVGLNANKVERLEYQPKNQSDLECVYSLQVSTKFSPMVRRMQAQKRLLGSN